MRHSLFHAICIRYVVGPDFLLTLHKYIAFAVETQTIQFDQEKGRTFTAIDFRSKSMLSSNHERKV